jgi:hypothetical protein
MQSQLPQFSGKGPTLVVKNTFIDEAPLPPSLERAQTAPAHLCDRVARADLGVGKPMFDEFREQSDTSCSDDSDQDSDCSTDQPECLGQYTATNALPPMVVGFPFPVLTQQPAAMFYNGFWPLDQKDAISQMSLGQESSQFAALQSNSTVVAPPLRSTKMHQGHYVPQPNVAPQPQTVSVREDPFSESSEIIWNVDARKLRTGDKQAVSPAFELALGDQFPAVTFKMLIYPSVKSEGKGGASFKNAKGQGRITIKCEGDVSGAPAHICFSLAIGNRGVRASETRHGMHNFAQSAICSLSGNEAEWDLSSVVDHASETFSVFLNVMHAQQLAGVNS